MDACPGWFPLWIICMKPAHAGLDDRSDREVFDRSTTELCLPLGASGRLSYNEPSPPSSNHLNLRLWTWL